MVAGVVEGVPLDWDSEDKEKLIISQRLHQDITPPVMSHDYSVHVEPVLDRNGMAFGKCISPQMYIHRSSTDDFHWKTKSHVVA